MFKVQILSQLEAEVPPNQCTHKATFAMSLFYCIFLLCLTNCLDESGSTQCTYVVYSLRRTHCLPREFPSSRSQSQQKGALWGKRKAGWVKTAGEATLEGPEASIRTLTGILRISGERWRRLGRAINFTFRIWSRCRSWGRWWRNWSLPCHHSATPR